MKRNTFYLLVGIVALLEVAAFWVSVELEMPLLIQVAFILGILLIYGARRTVEGRIEDERTSMITQKAALRTLEVFWVVFFAVNLGSAAWAFSRPLGLRPPPPHPVATWTPSPRDRLVRHHSDGTPLSDDIPLCRIQDVLRTQIWGMGRPMKNRIKVHRAMHDLTQEALANELGVTRQTILAIEKGKYDPSLDLAFKIARFFGVSIEEIFIYNDTAGPR